MLLELLQKACIFRLLDRTDTDLATEHRQKGCPHCGGRLQQANYARKPRGGPSAIPDEHMVRQAFCSSREHCRRRTLPPSCLFMGRRV